MGGYQWECRKTNVKVDGRREGGPQEDGCHRLEDTCTQKDRCHKLEDMCTQKDGCHKLEDTCTQKRRMEDGPTRTVEPWSSSSSSSSTRHYSKHFIVNLFIYKNHIC